MIAKPLKLGFIGGGLESAVGTTHKIASQMDNRWKLCAGCFSTDLNKNRLTAEAWQVDNDRVYSDWQALLNAGQEQLDAVVVLTPTPFHDDIVIAAIEQGYPVICEKALTTSSEKAKQISKLVAVNKGYLAVTYNYTGYPMLRELRAIIERGDLGELNQIHIEMPQEGFAKIGKDNSKPRPQSWRLQDDGVPTISLGLGVHVFHLIRFLSKAKPIELIATNNTFGLFDNVVDNCMCIAKYSGNLDCQIWFSKSALGHANGLRIRVYGFLGSAEWFQQSPETLLLNDNTGKQRTLNLTSAELQLADKHRYNRFKPGHPAGFIEAFANYYYDLADSVQEFKRNGSGSSPWIFGIDDALEGLVLLEAMANSAESRSWQRVDV